MTGTSAVVAPPQSQHEEKIPSSDDPPKKANTTPPRTDSIDDEQVITSSKSRGSVKQMLFSKITFKKQSSRTTKHNEAPPPNTSPDDTTTTTKSRQLSAAGEHFARLKAEEQMNAALILSQHHSTEVDEMDQYKHLSAAGEHFARLKSEGEHSGTPFRDAFSRMASSLLIGHNHHNHNGTTNTTNAENHSDEGRDEQQDMEEAVQQRQRSMSAAGEHFANKRAERKAEIMAAKKAAVVSSVEDVHDVDHPYRQLSAAGEHFAIQKAEKKKAAAEKRAEKTAASASSTLAAAVGGADQSVSSNTASAAANDDDGAAAVETNRYKHLSAAGEHFARKKSEECTSSPMLRGVISRIMTPSFLHLGSNSSEDDNNNGDNEDEDEEEVEAAAAPVVRQLSAAGEHFANKKAEKKRAAQQKVVVVAATKKVQEEKEMVGVVVVNPSIENNDKEVVGDDEERFKHLSSAGEHFARLKAEKKVEKASAAAAASAKKKKKARKEEEVATTTAAADHSIVSDEDGSRSKEIDKADDDDRYRHLSAAGEHFARKKSEQGESITSLLSRMTSSRLLTTGHQGQGQGGGSSTTAGSGEGREDEEEADRFKHLSSAGEHFARKKAVKKAEKAVAANKAVAAAADHSLVSDDYSSSETDRYKHLSAAGEHFARKKAEKNSSSSKCWDVLKKNSTTNRLVDGDDDDETTPFQYLSPGGKHFETKKNIEKKKNGETIASSPNKTEASISVEEEEETEEHLLLDSSNVSVRSYDLNVVVSPVDSSEEFSGMFVQEKTSDTSNYEKDCGDDRAADSSLDQAFDVVVQKLEEKGKEPTLTGEKDVAASLEEAENKKHHLVTKDAASTAAVQSQLDEIQRMPAYTLHRELIIGKGSYGQVFLASRGEAEGHFSSKPGKRKKFACKCVSLPADPKYICKLQEEVNVLRVLRGHVNVIRLYDVFVLDNELLIITELGTGGDLFHLLATHPKHGLSEEYAAKTVSDMLSAVAILHSLHICHRDLKIENWVLKSGNDLWSPLKLIDFGLSTHFTPGHKLSRVVGSSYYIAPEVLKKSYTEACDLWSLGVIVYMLLSGAPPFFGSSEEAIKDSILSGEYSFPHELFGDVSEDAVAFVSCLLSYDEDERYTAQQALNHPWLEAKCKPEQLLRCKAGAKP